MENYVKSGTEIFNDLIPRFCKEILKPKNKGNEKNSKTALNIITMADVNLMDADLNTIFPLLSETPEEYEARRRANWQTFEEEFAELEDIESIAPQSEAAPEILDEELPTPQFFEELEKSISEIDSIILEHHIPESPKPPPSSEDKEKAEELYSLAKSYKWGLNGKEKSLSKAYRTWMEAVELGHAPSEYAIGKLYFKGEYLKQSYVAAKAFFAGAAERGNVPALDYLGQIYEYGLGVTANDSEAAKYYLRAAAMGKARAMNHLGLMYLHGKGIPQDFSLAFDCFVKAIKKNHFEAMKHIAYLYLHGKGVAKDIEKALNWYTQAKEKGSLTACYCLGKMYETGEGVPVDLKKAWEYLYEAAEKGHACSMDAIGCWYRDGIDRNADPALAESWFRKAAKKGLANALYHLGDLIIKRDFDEGILYIIEAGRKNQPQAMKRLGWK